MGIALIAIVMIGLAQIFTMSIMNNLRSSELSNGTFLAQQQVDYLRTLLQAELNDFPQSSRGEANDEQLDTNSDGTADFRRITDVSLQGNFYEAPSPGLRPGSSRRFPDPASSGSGAVSRQGPDPYTYQQVIPWQT